ncbi:putative gluconeogenesis factor [Thermus thermophilus]|uniref:hypothetical protein n=1 Tax=Thermus thermophilus TaxID=274 RepID=UPI00090A1A55|nr:hypothetical protein [Thermus thermophilus]BAW00674.1 putative gluconeogenesis factor [Thermus thermophilus]BDB11387.1 hypothetical protein TthTMY_11260 [Thermus thermophilus]
MRRLPAWSWPLLLAFFALVGLGLLAVLWAVGVLALLGFGALSLLRSVWPRRRWRRLPPG